MYDINKNFHDFLQNVIDKFNGNAYTRNKYKYFTLLTRIL